MALNPYHRKSSPKYRAGLDTPPPKTSRVPWLISAIGLIALLGIVYQLSVSGLSTETAKFFTWSVQPPP
jgi:hypothetical protein